MSLDLILNEDHSGIPDLIAKFSELGGAFFSPTHKLSKEELREIFEMNPLASVIHQLKIGGSWYVLIHHITE